MFEGIDEPGRFPGVVFGGLPQFTGVDVLYHDTLTKIGKGDPVGLQHHIFCRRPTEGEKFGGCPANGIFHQVRRNFDHLAFFIHAGAGAMKNFKGLLILDKNARPGKHLESGRMNLLKLVVV